VTRPDVLSVSQVTRLIKQALSETFPAVWVKGEMSGVKRAPSGHVYFSLKEGREALIDCVMWSSEVPNLTFEPRDGTEVEAFGSISVYEPRGRYQLYARDLRPAGLGALLLKLEELKKKLLAEGLFEASRKKPLPRYPRSVGIVTSPTGAAVRDMIKVLRARWPSIRIILAPVKVQGEGAAREIAAAVERFNRYGAVDVLLVGRGGGSLEDLWAFNEEIVVRAVAESHIPVIAGVGHEVDQTLVELAADQRASTPSNAAEMAVRDRADVLHRVEVLEDRATRAVRQRLVDSRRDLAALVETYGFRRHRDLLDTYRERVDRIVADMAERMERLLQERRARVMQASQRYGLREWPRRITRHRGAVAESNRRMQTGLRQLLDARHTRLASQMDRMRALSPRRVLERGFCIARAADGTLLRAAETLSVGDRVALEFGRGSATTRVEDVHPGGHDVG
jgi:exodeoxyribonuclease VII large subunit